MFTIKSFLSLVTMSKGTISYPKREASSGFLLWQVSTSWQEGLKKCLAPHNLSHPEFTILAIMRYLADKKIAAHQRRLADHCKLGVMHVSKILNMLEKKNLIVRNEHQQDARAKNVSLTSAGQVKINAAVISVEDFDRQFFVPIQEHVTGFNQLLHSIVWGKAN